MRRLIAALAVTCGAALAMTALLVGGYLFDFARFCSQRHQADAARARGGDPGVLDSGSFVQARPGEQIAVCWNRHCPEVPTLTGYRYLSHFCHDDLGCYCVPTVGEVSGEQLAARLFFDQVQPHTCRIDKPHPNPDDATGACPHARCLKHLDP